MSTTPEILNQLGWDPSMVKVYVALLEGGELTVPKIVESTKLSRAMIYEVLPILVAQGFVEYRRAGRNAFYKPEHPNKLFSLIEEKKREMTAFEEEAKTTIKTLTGTFNLSQHKPGVRFFEGEEGLKEVLDDSLTAQNEILTYVDIEGIFNFIPKINDAYVRERQKRGIKKRTLALDSEFAREKIKSYYTDITDTKLIKHDAIPFQTVMQIYDGKVSYITMTKYALVGVIIQDTHIYQMHRYLFEHLWEITPKPFEKKSAGSAAEKKDPNDVGYNIPQF